MTDTNTSKHHDLGGKLLKGAAWMVAMRWGSRLMGLASMVVVARLLTQADFGIYAIATALIGLLDALTDIGSDVAIIRHPNPQKRHYDTAWTFKVIIHGACALLILAFAPLAAHLYDSDQYIAILQVLALSLLISGLSNIGIADFRRNLDFHSDFIFNISVQVAGVLTTLVVAYLTHSYWALVLGGLAKSVVSLALSFVMHPHRPRFTLSAKDEIFNFSLWVMVRSVGIFLVTNGDRLVLGAFYSASLTGAYAMAAALANMAIYELLNPIGRALLPGMASKQGDADWERRNLKKIFGGVASLSVAIGVGVASLASPAIRLVYGPGYSDTIPMLEIMALAAALSGFNQPVGQYLTVLGRVKDLAFLLFFEGIATMVVTYGFAVLGYSIHEVLYARLAVSCLVFVRVFYLMRIVKSVTTAELAIEWLRPCLAGLAMFLVLTLYQRAFSDLPDLALFAGGVLIGALTYSLTVLGLWHLMRRPSGIEEEVLSRVLRKASL